MPKATNLITPVPLRSAKPAPDPIFAALEAWRRAWDLWLPVDGNIPDELTDQHYEAFSVVIRTRPTTLAGLAALTAWTRERADWLLANGSIMHDEDLCTLTASIADATAALMAVRKPARRKAVAS